MARKTLPGGTFTMAEDLMVTRMGYGAMQLAGPGVFGPPQDRDGAVAVLREAVDLGITHIDTSDYYGPYITNQIIKEALHPYSDSVHSHKRSERCETQKAASLTRALPSNCARPCTTTSSTSDWMCSTSSTCAWEGSTARLPARSQSRSPLSRNCSRRE